MVHNRNKSAIGTCIPDVIGIMFFRDMPQQVSFIISEVSFAQTFFSVVALEQKFGLGMFFICENGERRSCRACLEQWVPQIHRLVKYETPPPL